MKYHTNLKFKPIIFLIFFIIYIADVIIGDTINVILGWNSLIIIFLGLLYFTICFTGGLFFINWCVNTGRNFNTSLACWILGVCIITITLVTIIPNTYWKLNIGSSALIGLIGLAITIAKNIKDTKKAINTENIDANNSQDRNRR